MFTLAVDDELGLELLSPWVSAEIFEVIDSSRPHLEPWIPFAAQIRQPEHAERFMLQLLDEYATGSALHTVMRLDGRAAGIISLDPIKTRPGITEVSFWLGSTFTGRGIATRSCRALIDLAFGRLGLQRVTMRCAEGNSASWAVAERLGFAYEGTLRRAGRVGDRWDDLRLYAVLKNEWTSG